MNLCRYLACFLLLLVSTIAMADESTWLLTESQTTAAHGEQQVATTAFGSLRKVGGALAIVVGGFFLVVVMMRKREAPQATKQLMHCLGSTQIAPNIRLHLVRLGQRILVLHINGQNVQRVAEVDDEEEVASILAASDQRIDNQTDAMTVPRSVDELMRGHANGTARAVR